MTVVAVGVGLATALLLLLLFVSKLWRWFDEPFENVAICPLVV